MIYEYYYILETLNTRNGRGVKTQDICLRASPEYLCCRALTMSFDDRKEGDSVSEGDGNGSGGWRDSPVSHTLSNSHPRVLLKTRSLKNMRPISGRFDEFSYEVHESQRALQDIEVDVLKLGARTVVGEADAQGPVVLDNNRSSSGSSNRLSQHLAATRHGSVNLRGSSKDGISTTLTAARC